MPSYKIQIHDEQQSTVITRMDNGASVKKDVVTKDLINSFSLEQKLISFSFLSPGVVKHHKQGTTYTVAILLPAGKTASGVSVPATLALVKTNIQFNILHDIKMYQVAGLGYRGPSTELVDFPYAIPREAFGTQMSKNVTRVIQDKLAAALEGMVANGKINLTGGKQVKASDFIKEHKDSVLLKADYCLKEKRDPGVVFKQFTN